MIKMSSKTGLQVANLESDLMEESKWPLWLSWTPTSKLLLYTAEAKLLNRLKSHCESFYVPVLGNLSRIRTLIARRPIPSSSQHDATYMARAPLVLVHGMGAGIGMWCKNIDALAAHRQVYAFDVLGFGRSSRPDFPTTADSAEDQFVRSMENWREDLHLEQFILLGHSMGGFLAFSYAIRHPERISQLILVDPWGFPERPANANLRRSNVFIRVLIHLMSPFNPLSVLRAAGPFGLTLVRSFRQDLGLTFRPPAPQLHETIPILLEDLENSTDEADRQLAGNLTSDDEPIYPTPGDPGRLRVRRHHVSGGSGSDPVPTPRRTSDVRAPVVSYAGDAAGVGADENENAIFEYIYHANAQKPSGEAGFKAMSHGVGWAANPMLGRVADLHPNVPVTFIYGGRSWMDSQSGCQTRALRPDSYVDVKILDGAGHHLYAEAPDEFNAYVNQIGARVDAGDKFEPSSYPSSFIIGRSSVAGASALVGSPTATNGTPMSRHPPRRKHPHTTRKEKPQLGVPIISKDFKEGEDDNSLIEEERGVPGASGDE